jgi:hypothetical protein
MSPVLQAAVATALLNAPDPDAVMVDTETFYSKTCSVKDLGNWAYCRHSDWDCYLVSIFSRDISFVGHPSQAPWEKIAGRTWLSHNRNFDRTVIERLIEQKLVPNVRPKVWHDTADLAAWCHLPRNLAGAAAYGLEITHSKTTRDSMKGKRWTDMSPEFRNEVCVYALDDAILGWLLWQKFSPQWPEHERQLSLHTGEIEFRGIPTDREKLDGYIRTLKQALWVIEQSIPWITETDEKGKPYALTSPRAIEKECVKADVPVPSTTSIKKAEFIEWLDEYGDAVPALRQLAHWRKINRALNLFESWLERIRPDGRAAIGLMYFGAQKTGRWSGTSGVSLHNLEKQPLLLDEEFRWLDRITDKKGKVTGGRLGDVIVPLTECQVIDARSCIVGTLGIADLSQIEPRVLNWIVGNRDFLAYCASGMSPYEAHARASMGWTGGELKTENPALYALAKARVLALGYGAGWHKFITMVLQYVSADEFELIFNAEVSAEQEEAFLSFLAWMANVKNNREAKKKILLFNTELDRREKNIWVNAWVQVMGFRHDNPLIKDFWGTLDAAFKASVSDGVFENELPSGRSLKYFNVSSSGGWTAKQGNPGAFKVTRVYGGLAVENCVQAIARDVFALGVLRLEAAGFRVLFHVHDEVILEMQAGQTIKQALDILGETPAWAAGLPVAAEGKISKHYTK